MVKRIPAGWRTEPNDATALYAAVLAAPFGRIGIRVRGALLTRVEYLPPDGPVVEPAGPFARAVCGQLQAYLRDPRHVFDMPWVAEGTPHQRSVWQALLAIPCGEVRTYGELAAQLASGARAVGAACGSNPVPLVVPCHRVVAAGGRLGGFMHSRSSFPLDVKRWLLAHESS